MTKIFFGTFCAVSFHATPTEHKAKPNIFYNCSAKM